MKGLACMMAVGPSGVPIPPCWSSSVKTAILKGQAIETRLFQPAMTALVTSVALHYGHATADVRFTPEATKLLRCREMTRWAISGHDGNSQALRECPSAPSGGQLRVQARNS